MGRTGFSLARGRERSPHAGTMVTPKRSEKHRFTRWIERAIRAEALGVRLRKASPQRSASARAEAEHGYTSSPLRGRLMVGRLTLDQVVKVRVLAPQPSKARS
jgi:hypothetical protein